MLKRVNKITALLVVAATVISTMPVMASETNKIPRLGELDGGITDAVAYADGKYIYEGNKPDQDYGVYYNDGTKDTKLEDVDDLDEYTKYGDSIIVTDGNDEQKINLVDGTVSTDGDRDDELVDAETKLRTTLSKTNKYGSDTEIKSFTEVSNEKFGDGVWYEYTATGNESYYKDINDEVDPTDPTDPTDEVDPTDPSDEEQPVSQITVKINFFWSAFTLAGQTLSSAQNDYAGLAELIKNTEFEGYKVQSATATGDSTTVVFTTTEDLGGVVPDGFIDSNILNWTSGFAETPVAESWKSIETEPKSKISVKINFFWSAFTLAGQTLSSAQNDYAGLAELIKNTEFEGYKVLSVTAADDSTTVVFTTTEDLGGVVPDGFIDSNILNWTSGFAETPVASAYDPITDANTDTDTDEDPDPTTEEKVIYYGYADTNGNYIDCSKIANIRVYNGEDVVKVDEFNDKKVSGDVKVKLGLPTLTKTLGQDVNYLYALIEVPVTGYQALNGAEKDSNAVTNLNYVQKISKAYGNKDGGAYLPHDVDSYYLANDCGWTGGDNWAYTAAYFFINDTDRDEVRTQFNVNEIYSTKTTVDNGELMISSAKIKLKKQSKQTPISDEIYGERKKIIQPMVFMDGSNTTKIGDDSNDTESGSWTVDSQGNAWSIYNGRIKMSGQGGEFEDKYRCASMNRLSVYDENNLIAWEDGGDTYVTVKDGEVVEHVVTKNGWQKAEDGSWHLYQLTGVDSKGWVNYSACWYYFDENGAMKTGWADIDGKTYYLGASGVRAIGWTKVDGEYYYFDASGVKQVSTTIDGYKLNSKGARVN